MGSRAGHGWTWFTRNGKSVHLIANDAGHWITTGEAQGWARCPRCRRPFEACSIGSKGLCYICYFYKSGMPIDEFWRLHNDGHYLAPYNMGRRSMANRFDLRGLEDLRVNWRRYLKTQAP